MPEKYLTAGSPTIVTNDLFLAAFLCTLDCELVRVERNRRRRVSFVFEGERVLELREAYRCGPVRVDMLCFRENLNRLRDLLSARGAGQSPDERSMPCPTESLMRSLRV